MKDLLDQIVRPVRQTFSTTYTSDGVIKSDNSNLLLELFENTYFHLTGRSPTQQRYVIRILSTEDYWRVSDEEGYPGGKAAAGWCCREKEDGVHMYVNADKPLPRALGTVFHEVGHGLHRILNLEQTSRAYDIASTSGKIQTYRAYQEAIAMVFEAANLRILAEHTGVETSALPEGWYIPDSYIDSILISVATLSNSEVYGPEAYDRGRLLIWTAVLKDPELSHLRQEFETNGRLSGSSLYEVFLKLVNMSGDEISSYIDSVAPDGDLAEISRVIRDTVQKRIGQRGLEYPELAREMYDSIVLP